MCKKSRITAVILIAVMVMSLLPTGVFADNNDGWNGQDVSAVETVDSTYQIGSAAELAWFADKVNDGTLNTANAKLTADIDLNNREWNDFSIGNSSNTYKGVFDGNNHSILNLSLTGTAADKGLFGKNEGTIKNIANITGTVKSTYSRTGSIAGWNTANGIISSCNSEVRVTLDSVSSSRYLGGISGQNNGLIEKSAFSGTVTAADTGGHRIGGITGYNLAGSIAGCVNYGFITGHNATSALEAGGIAGRNETLLFNCYNEGAISSGDSATNTKLGGIAGANNSNNAYLFNCYSTGIISGGGSNMGIVGNTSTSNSPKSSNNYFIAGSDTANSTLISSENLASEDMIDTLNADNPYDIAVNDDIKYVRGINAPKFAWQNSSAVDPDSEPSEQDIADVEAAAALFNWGALIPEYGTDSNIVTFIENKIENAGYRDIKVTLKSTNNEEYVALNGDVKYFYHDPSDMASIFYNVHKYVRIDFELNKSGAKETVSDKQVNLYWDIGMLNAALENQILDNITSDLIKEANDSLDNVVSNLSLPKYLEGIKWCEIKWESSNTDVIAIEPNKGSTADDQISGSYTGVVKRDPENQDVTLTATLDFSRTHNSFEKEQTALTKTFSINVKGLTGSLQEDMQAQLDNNYTVEKLKDSDTGIVIDPNDVQNDIQLLIPRNTGIENYNNYKFTVASNDPDVVVNGYKAVVYRPLPGEPEKDVELTVTMSHKNYNVSVTKDIPIKITPLSQDVIDAEIQLMEKVKESYFDGIKGNNISINNIETNMTAFKEASYSSDGTSIDWIYHVDNKKGMGIIPVDIDLSHPSEQWNLFKSSNPQIISHENLLYTQPEYDRDVTIESCLSSYVYGKYAEKYPANTDFAKLYRQPVSVTVKVPGVNGSGVPVENYNITFGLYGTDNNSGVPKHNYKVWITPSSVTINEGESVWDVTKRLLSQNGYEYDGNDAFLKSITAPNGTKIGNLTNGPNSGWMFMVNDVIPDTIASQTYLKESDTLEWFYTDDYTKEYKKPVSEPENKYYKISSSASKGGKITASGKYRYGSNKKYMYTPNSGYKVVKLVVDGKAITFKATGGTYEFKNIKADHSIFVYFQKDTAAPGDLTKSKKAAPKRFTVKAEKKKAKLSWKKSKNVTKYQVAYKQKGKKKWKKKTISATKKTITIKKLKKNKKYQFKIRSYKKSKGKKVYSKWSKTKTVRIR